VVPFNAALHYFAVFRKYLGRRLYLVSLLTLLAATTEGIGIALLLPLLSLLGVRDAGPAAAGPAAGAGSGRSTLEAFVSDITVALGIHDSMAGILAFMMFVFVLKGVLKFTEGAYKSYLQAQLLREVESRLFDAYSTMEYRYYSRYSAGHFSNLISVQAPRLVTCFDRYKKFLGALITVVAYFVFAFLVSWPVAAMATVAGGATLVIFRRLTERVRQWSRRGVAEQGTLNHFLVQTLQAYKYLAATAQLGPMRAAVLKSISRVSDVLRRTETAWSLTEALQEPLAVGVLVAIIAVQIAFLQQALAPVLVGVALIYRSMSQLVLVQGHWQAMMHDVGSLETVEAELDRVADHQEHSGSVVLGPFSRAVTLHRVSFRYDAGAERNTLSDISLTIPANRTVAIVGESGSGKTTLVDLLTLVLRPQRGSLTIDGVPHEEIDIRSWREQIGYVAQDTVVFDDTIANNICLWRGDYATDPDVRRRVEHAAARAGAEPFIEALPDGFNTSVGDRGIRLSGGQRQRLFIARELYRNPRLLILDEATSALDSESELVIKDTVDHLKGTTTVVIIAHRLATIRNADYIYVLDGGRIVEHGTYDRLACADGGAFNRMVALQRL
jgi:ABC-type multidrug transport system fused ATPase/permease subunit